MKHEKITPKNSSSFRSLIQLATNQASIPLDPRLSLDGALTACSLVARPRTCMSHARWQLSSAESLLDLACQRRTLLYSTTAGVHRPWCRPSVPTNVTSPQWLRIGTIQQAQETSKLIPMVYKDQSSPWKRSSSSILTPQSLILQSSYLSS